MFASRRSHTRRPGNILLLALLMLAGGLVGGLTVAALVVGELRQANALDNGFTAYTQAESGLEQSLYNVRQDKVCDPTTACNDPSAQYALCNFTTATTTVTGVSFPCGRKIVPANLVNVSYLDTDQNFQLDFNPPLSASCVTPPPITINVSQWNRTKEAAAGGVQPSLEISYIDQLPGAGSIRVYHPGIGLPYECGATACSTPPSCNQTQYLLCQPQSLPFPFTCADEPPTTQLYQVRVKALKAPVTDLRFTLSGNASNYLDLWSQGLQNKTTQTLKTTVLKRAPAYGFSDYVIFSEQDIVK